MALLKRLGDGGEYILDAFERVSGLKNFKDEIQEKTLFSKTDSRLVNGKLLNSPSLTGNLTPEVS